MSTQQLRLFQRGERGTENAGSHAAPARLHIRQHHRADRGGCYEMYEVVQVGGVTRLEWMVLVLFVTLFAWIAFSFSSALAGFAVLLFSSRGSARHRSRSAASARRKQKCDVAADLQ